MCATGGVAGGFAPSPVPLSRMQPCIEIPVNMFLLVKLVIETGNSRATFRLIHIRIRVYDWSTNATRQEDDTMSGTDTHNKDTANSQTDGVGRWHRVVKASIHNTTLFWTDLGLTFDFPSGQPPHKPENRKVTAHLSYRRDGTFDVGHIELDGRHVANGTMRESYPGQGTLVCETDFGRSQHGGTDLGEKLAGEIARQLAAQAAPFMETLRREHMLDEKPETGRKKGRGRQGMSAAV